MWTCPSCNQKFLHKEQKHSCNDKTLDDFLKGKPAHTIELFEHFLESYRKIGDFVLHPAKSRIALAKHTRFCSINQLGKDFIHVVFQFNEPFHDNLCFIKIGQLPGENNWNHHCRLYRKEDLNAEVKKYMKMAYQRGLREKK